MIINKLTFKQRLHEYKNNPTSLLLLILVLASMVITVALVVVLIAYILIKGIPYINADLFALEYTSKNVSMMPAIINTFIMTVLTLIIAVPIGVFSAIYLVEYAPRGSKLVKVIDITTQTLSGIPSIVYGLFGFLMFNVAFKWGYSMLGGAFTLSIMILPLIMNTTSEALIAVPDSYREGSFGLGAGKIRTIFKIILPSAMPGILSGVILGIGRVVGETAALIYTAGTLAEVPKNLLSSGRTLAIHMYALLSEGLYINEAYATAVVLLVIVLAINLMSELIAKRLATK